MKALGVVAFLTFVGCTTTSSSRIEIRGDQVAIDVAYRLVSSLRERDAELHSFKGLYQVKFRQGDERWGLRQVVVFERPSKFRLETLPKTGAYALNLLVTKEQSALYLDNVEKRVIEGKELEAFFRQFFKLPAGEKEMMSFFGGRIPVRYLDAPDLRIYEEEDAYVIVKGDKEYVWRISKETLVVSDFEVRNRFSDALLFSVEFDSMQLKPVSGGSAVVIPTSYSLYDRKEDFEMKGILQNVQLGEQIRSSLFEVEIPADYERSEGL
jgi:outer membrane lipoprotein-sorting protein